MHRPHVFSKNITTEATIIMLWNTVLLHVKDTVSLWSSGTVDLSLNERRGLRSILGWDSSTHLKDPEPLSSTGKLLFLFPGCVCSYPPLYLSLAFPYFQLGILTRSWYLNQNLKVGTGIRLQEKSLHVRCFCSVCHIPPPQPSWLQLVQPCPFWMSTHMLTSHPNRSHCSSCCRGCPSPEPLELSVLDWMKDPHFLPLWSYPCCLALVFLSWLRHEDSAHAAHTPANQASHSGHGFYIYFSFLYFGDCLSFSFDFCPTPENA